MPVTTNIDSTRALLLIDASIESYYALDAHDPARCNCSAERVKPPDGYDLVDCWTGIDTVFGTYNVVECFGLVFRSQATPYTYIFAFRGTYSLLDALGDAEFWEKDPFVPFSSPATTPGAAVASGFWSIYHSSLPGTPSMQAQLFSLLDKYHGSDKPIGQLLITGHSLGAALCELFTLDLACSSYRELEYVNYNYACPRVGNAAFAQFYNSQPREQEPATRTLRIQNTYDIVPGNPPELLDYQHIGDAYLLAFYNKDAGYLDPRAKLWDHQALNYQAVLSCASQSPTGICVNPGLPVDTDAETLVSIEPDPSTLCWFMSATGIPVPASEVAKATIGYPPVAPRHRR